MNDPDTNDPKKPANEPKPISSWGESNEKQTPAYNDPDNWDRYSNPQDSNTNYQAQPPTPETATVNPETSLEQNYQPEQSSSQENSYEGPSQETGQPEEIVGQSQPEQPQNQPMLENPASQPKPKSSMGLMIIMVTVVIILTGATALLAFQNYQLRKEKSVQPTPTPSIEPTATPDPTADWKTFTGSTYSFKYPGDAVVSGAGQYDQLRRFGATQQEGTEITDAIALDFTMLKLSGQELKVYLENKIENDKILGPILSPLTSVTVAGLSGFTYKQQGLGGQPTFFYLQSSDKKQIVEIKDFTVDPGNSSYKETVDQILSTFKFVSDNPTASPLSSSGNCASGYQKFSNANFSFCYPTGMKETTGSSATNVVLENATETLKVVQNFQGGWGGSPCLAINSVEVAGYPSKRLSWKTENTDGTCAETLTSFATMINEGVFTSPFPYMMELTRKTGTYPDNTKFVTIESSFAPASAN